MESQKVTRDALRDLEMGQTQVFKNLSPAEIETARATASQMGRLLECKFTVSSNYDARTVTITKTAL